MKVLLIKGNMYDPSKKFVFPPTSNAQLDTQTLYSPPLGLLYMASCLQNEGHSVKVIDCFHEKNPIDAIQHSIKSVDAIGLSIFTDYLKYSVDIAQYIKETDPDLPVIIGGCHSTFFPTKALHDVPAADISVAGDGEYAFIEILKTLKGNKSLSDIHGIHYRQKNKIKKGKPPKLIEDLDSLPFPARELVEKYEYGKLNNIYFRKPKYTCFATGRGCPYHCRFCNHIFSPLQKYRKRSVENVVSEFQEINDKYNSVYIIDDSFFINSKRVEMIMDGIIKSGLDFELYIYGGRVGLTDREVYKKMKKAGVKRIFYGVESGCQEILDFYKKGTTLEEIQKSINLANEMDIFTIGSFIFGAPIETKKHIEETVKFACSLPFDTTYWRHLIYEYGSDLWNEAISNKKIKENEGMFIWADSERELGNFTKEELDKFCKKAFIKFYLRPQYLIRTFLKTLRNRDFAYFKAAIKFF
ncbi:hypothetical protein AYK24_02940 [Thermoplasmatales archaeon SG8-52-4]|nr:MAG: hypothetical protein AYK24_02940 [Thermoplasmatales archaeon SG8-52-4]